MSTSATVHIHIISPVVGKDINIDDSIEHLQGKSLYITHETLDHGPSSIQSGFDEVLAAPDTVRKAMDAERAGADAIVIDCMGDPGVEAAREVVKTLVLGPCETSMHLAAILGHRFSVVATTTSAKPMFYKEARKHGVLDKLASIRVINMPPLEIEKRIDETKQLLAQEAVSAVEQDDAAVIILGSTGFSSCREEISEHLRAKGHDVPVIDPLPATVCFAEAMVKAGLAHSKRTYESPSITERHETLLDHA